MRGSLGEVSLSQPTAEVVRRMAHQLTDCGSHASALRQWDQCVLGHKRLRIIDLSPGADQPQTNENQTDWVKRVSEGANVIVKLDIDGSEQELSRCETDWLTWVDGLIVKFDPDRVDYLGLTRMLQAAGFDYLSAESSGPGSLDAFQHAGYVN